MTVFKTSKGNFTYRVAGVVLKDNKVLLHRAEFDDFWALPGGSAEIFETSEEVLKREFLEESGITIEVERLLWVVENFFEYDKEKYHEIGLYFLVVPLDSEEKLQQDEFIGIEEYFNNEKYGKFKLIFRWFTMEQLDDIVVKPKFLNEALKKIPEHPKHIHTS
ncbi:MAG: NUDIX hydrolase [Candidatus Heimdallarchaeota archaeon]